MVEASDALREASGLYGPDSESWRVNREGVLLLASGPRRGKDFQGRLELVVNLTEGGRSAMIVVPGQGQADNAAFRLGFKHFQRVDGTFRVDPKGKVVSVQLRVYETGLAEPKVTRTVTLG